MNSEISLITSIVDSWLKADIFKENSDGVEIEKLLESVTCNQFIYNDEIILSVTKISKPHTNIYIINLILGKQIKAVVLDASEYIVNLNYIQYPVENLNVIKEDELLNIKKFLASKFLEYSKEKDVRDDFKSLEDKKNLPSSFESPKLFTIDPAFAAPKSNLKLESKSVPESLQPPKFDDEYEIQTNAPPAASIRPTNPLSIGDRDLNPPGLPKHPEMKPYLDPLASCSGASGIGSEGGMYPTANHPIFGGRPNGGGNNYGRRDPLHPPGARFDDPLMNEDTDMELVGQGLPGNLGIGNHGRRGGAGTNPFGRNAGGNAGGFGGFDGGFI
ncbi:hypothetical protein PACTADRAFT_51195 [Pachysolen tannophilus NRRL Y-2460]|uniref:PI31 proteasome regulator C-terminal domain-containing protein n=1 Tax=Pachysolen tannophilus NRRL Y-2460 TaxID=669874 RepID=A0A1E4TRE6_PACTA|nr:hypothetical protein PACTADRAFT_51195 [Pachysolen tannophilus NRRL Y-2460]